MTNQEQITTIMKLRPLLLILFTTIFVFSCSSDSQDDVGNTDDGIVGGNDDDGGTGNGDPIIFTGSIITFTRPDNADFMLAENQDIITENVIITRADRMGIFNIAQESGFAGGRRDSPSPIGTLWAVGTTADDLSSLTFAPWGETVDGLGGPREAAANQTNLVLQLTEENIFIDLVFTSFSGGGGGGFSYQRSTRE